MFVKRYYSPIYLIQICKNFYPFQVTDLRHQVDQITPKKNQLFEEFSGDPAHERLFIVLTRHRQFDMISDGDKIVEVNVI